VETTHRVVVDDARELDLPADSVDLVVTSPPYPMVEMWDEAFAAQSPAVEDALETGDGPAAFDAMHAVLGEVWSELERVLVDGGIACVNVGDATRTLGDRFRVYPNHSRVVEAFVERGFDSLPELLWRKPTNSAAKFMGSGMLPPNAYVTLEHEYVLVFRNGDRRSFPPRADRRYEAAYFWEERNEWFSDVWTDLPGVDQALATARESSGEGERPTGNGHGRPATEVRERSAAYPFAVPYRLVNMYSVYGDTVLDPFWGTGTTTLAAMVAGRSSVGYEREAGVADAFDDRVEDLPALSRSVVDRRLADHRAFVERSGDLAYEADHYDFPVRTRQERSIQLYAVTGVTETEAGYRVTHAPR
jgi:DNA modification methylase